MVSVLRARAITSNVQDRGTLCVHLRSLLRMRRMQKVFSGRRLLLVIAVPSRNMRRYWRSSARSMTHPRAGVNKAKHVRAQSE